MYGVEANSVSCIFEKEDDAINAFMMALAMVEEFDMGKLYKRIKFDINNRKDNTYEHNYYMSIRKYEN